MGLTAVIAQRGKLRIIYPDNIPIDAVDQSTAGTHEVISASGVSRTGDVARHAARGVARDDRVVQTQARGSAGGVQENVSVPEVA